MLAVRLAVRKVLVADQFLEAAVRSMLNGARGVTQQALVERSVCITGPDQAIVNYRRLGRVTGLYDV
jgi:hypothetical protein